MVLTARCLSRRLIHAAALYKPISAHNPSAAPWTTALNGSQAPCCKMGSGRSCCVTPQKVC
jgi:hypothetical protein